MSYQPAVYASGDVFISYPTSAIRTAAGGVGGGFVATSLGGTRFTSPGVRQGAQSTGDTRGANTGAALAAQNAKMHAESIAATGALGHAAQAAAAVAGVYIIPTATQPYVGQSNNIDRRLKEHGRSGNYTQEEVDDAQRIAVPGSKTDREIREMIEILKRGGKDNTRNKVNPLGPTRKDLLPSPWQELYR
ncbi:GIY-YIG nuclease family protein [Paenarthrobacter sp. NPDC056912]|uniref:GIY-YIG nuclease family protein n=1 Tax=Paenarthrobacter sp. NPDC056912 TaxID=3345965 RepID=UPI003672F426